MKLAVYCFALIFSAIGANAQSIPDVMRLVTRSRQRQVGYPTPADRRSSI